jgi:hypothetical protein
VGRWGLSTRPHLNYGFQLTGVRALAPVSPLSSRLEEGDDRAARYIRLGHIWGGVGTSERRWLRRRTSKRVPRHHAELYMIRSGPFRRLFNECQLLPPRCRDRVPRMTDLRPRLVLLQEGEEMARGLFLLSCFAASSVGAAAACECEPADMGGGVKVQRMQQPAILS